MPDYLPSILQKAIILYTIGCGDQCAQKTFVRSFEKHLENFLTPDRETFPLMTEPLWHHHSPGFPNLEEPPRLECPPKSFRGMVSPLAEKACWQTAKNRSSLREKVQVTHSGRTKETSSLPVFISSIMRLNSLRPSMDFLDLPTSSYSPAIS